MRGKLLPLEIKNVSYDRHSPIVRSISLAWKSRSDKLEMVTIFVGEPPVESEVKRCAQWFSQRLKPWASAEARLPWGLRDG